MPPGREMVWLDKRGVSHNLASCHCWRCHIHRLTGLTSGGRIAEHEPRLEPQRLNLSTTIQYPRTATVAESAQASRSRWLVLGIVLIGSFMAVLDVFIVTQGLPSIKTTLGAAGADLELVVSVYSLVYAALLVTGGRLGDILDRKRIFLFGMTVFTVASGLAGYAPSPAFLIFSRALQGIGAALMYPQVLSIIQVTFKGTDRSLALALFAAINGIGAITGNILGEFLIQLNISGLSWRPIFLVNVPIGIVGLVVGYMVLRPSRSQRPPRLDLLGVGLITLFLVSLVLPLSQGQQLGWPLWTVMLLVLTFPILGLFIIHERRLTDKEQDPLIDLDLFRHRSFAIGIPLTLSYYVLASGFFFTFVLFLQSGLGFSPLASGLAFGIINVGFITASLLGPRLIPRFGTQVLSFGYAIQIVGFVAVLITLNSYGTSLNLYELTVPLLIFGEGAGLVLSPLLGIVLAGVPTRVAGEASGVVPTSFQIGNSIGISLFGLLFYSFVGNQESAVSYLDASERVLPIFALIALSAFLTVFLLSPRRARMIQLLEPRTVTEE
ncbi:MAG TPA: MFS transporter [Candidatus Angelobacter sp.]|nr:MFS transporter [Candidatus Angelobacter sp.]